MWPQTDPSSSRRKFVKSFALLTASSFLLGRRWTAIVLAEVRPLANANTAVFRIKVTDYPALAKDYGSVRISTSAVAGTRSTSIFPVIMINRALGNRFHALDAACTHEGCILPTLNAATRRMECRCHGSRFAVNGALLRGPAGQELVQYHSSFDGKDTLTIEVPELGFSLVSSKLQTSPGRVQLEFLAFQNIQYEVNTRALFSEPWQSVPFAVTPEGPIDQTIFNGKDDFAKLYVSTTKASAFLAVSMRLRQV